MTQKRAALVTQFATHDYRDTKLTDAASELVQVSDDARALIEQSMSDNTHRAYETSLKNFATWLGDRHVSDATIADYLGHLNAQGRSVSTARMVVAALRKLASEQHVATPVGELTAKALHGFARAAKGRGRGQAHGITWTDVDTICNVASADGSLVGLRDAAIVAVMSDALLRVSEVAALRVTDIAYADDASGRVTIASSKTDQTGKGATCYLGAPTIERVNAWLDASSIRRGYLFRRARPVACVRDDTPLHPHTIRNIVQRCARAAGLRDVRISGHSLRVGSAQSLASRGASLVQMQQAGRWESATMPYRYAANEVASRGAVARLRYEQD